MSDVSKIKFYDNNENLNIKDTTAREGVSNNTSAISVINANLKKPPLYNTLKRILIITDSYGVPRSNEQTFIQMINNLNLANVKGIASNGSGFATQGEGGKTFAEQFTADGGTYDEVYVLGGWNDRYNDYNKVKTGINSLYSAMISKNSNSVLHIVPCAYSTSKTNASYYGFVEVSCYLYNRICYEDHDGKTVFHGGLFQCLRCTDVGGDGLHPNQNGQYKIFQLLSSIINGVEPSTSEFLTGEIAMNGTYTAGENNIVSVFVNDNMTSIEINFDGLNGAKSFPRNDWLTIGTVPWLQERFRPMDFASFKWLNCANKNAGGTWTNAPYDIRFNNGNVQVRTRFVDPSTGWGSYTTNNFVCQGIITVPTWTVI